MDTAAQRKGPPQKVVWGARAAAASRPGPAAAAGRRSKAQQQTAPQIAKSAAKCKEGCCDDASNAKKTTTGQGKSYLRRYGLAQPAAPVKARKVTSDDDDAFELVVQPATAVGPQPCDQRGTCAVGGDCCKGKERDLEQGLQAQVGVSDLMLGWGLDVVGGDAIADAAAGVAVECCRLCLELDECCRLMCCAVVCCVSELTSSLLEKKAKSQPVPPTDSLTTVHLNLSGLDCADCSLTVERTLKRNPAIVAVVVSAMTNKAEVTYDALRTDEAVILKDVRALGFGAELASPASTTRLLLRVVPVPDSAAADDSDLSKLLAGVKNEPGIVNAIHKRKKQLLIVDYYPAQARIRTLVEALESSGLSVRVMREEPGKTRAQKQVRSWQWRFWVSAVLSVPVLLIAFLFPHLPTVSDAFDEELTQGLSVGVFVCWVLATPIQFVMAWPLYGSSYRALRYGHKANMDTLVILSTLTAYVYSVVAVIVAMSGAGFEGDTFFETSAILLTLIMLGRYLEALARGKACNVVSSLRNEQATTAQLLISTELSGSDKTDDEQSVQEERDMDVEFIQPGDTIKVVPGAKVAVDGVVIFGSSSVDESLVTGESLPVAKSVGSIVLGGTINQHGTIHVQATKSASESTLAAISRLVEDAQAGKPRLQRIADVIASYFVPVILLLALAVLAMWLCLSALEVVDTDGDHWVPFSLQFAFAVLVVSCPCAIGLAVPLAVMVASGVGAKHGVVIKSGAIFEACRRINTVVFDKTGTLTLGQLSVVDHWWLASHDESDDAHHDQLLALIGSAERGSEHVLAKAVVQFIESQEGEVPALTEPDDFTAVPGRGLSARVQSHQVLVGNRAWMQDNGIALDDDHETASRVANHESAGRTVVWAAVDGCAVCVMALEDSLRPEAHHVVKRLRSKGVDVWVLSGDQQRTVHAVARRLGIEEANAIGGLAPEDKVDKIRRLQLNAAVNSSCGYNSDNQPAKLDDSNDDNGDMKKRTRKPVVAMVGDGVNDAPSLAQADVGVAVGGGADIAIAAGDVVLMRSDLHDVLLMIHLARRTHAIITLNFVWAFVYNAVAIPLAAGVLYPGARFVIPPAAAGLSEILSSLPIILFSLLLRLYRPPQRKVDMQS